MFKKTVIFSVAVALIMLGLFVDPSAAQVTSISKRGSLLIFPKIKTYSRDIGIVDTIITIGNDSSSPTWVKCYWMDKDQNPSDFEIYLTANQAIWFTAWQGYGTVDVSEFGDNKTGELKCWAVDIDPPAQYSTEILKKFNFLYGSAVLVQSDPFPAAFEYQAWAFNANNLPSPAGPINLNGNEYDYCPAYLAYNFYAYDGWVGIDYGSEFPWDHLAVAGNSYLSLSPCQQDLRQDRSPVCTKAQFNIWNENEVKFTGAYQCVKCYFEGVLTGIGGSKWSKCDLNYYDKAGNFLFNKCKATGVGGNKFTYDVLHTDLGRTRVSPSLSTACNGVFARFGEFGNRSQWR